MVKKKILITGATGFLGSAFLKRGRELEAQLYPTASEKGKRQGVTIEGMDLTNFPEVSKVIKRVKPEIIYHLGAFVNLARDFQVAQKCIEANFKGTLHLLEALRDIKLERLIYANTEEVYGEGLIPYQEDKVVNPPSPYAITKIAGEYLSKIYAHTFGFKLISLRIGTFYGPGQPKHRFISQIIIRALKNEDIPLTSGKKKRDYVYIDDVIDALVLAKEVSLSEDFVVINIGGGVSYSLKELVEKVLKITKSKSKCLYGKISERALEADKWLMDIGRAWQLLSWKPKTSLEEGIKKTVAYYRNLAQSYG